MGSKIHNIVDQQMNNPDGMFGTNYFLDTWYNNFNLSKKVHQCYPTFYLSLSAFAIS